MSLTRQFLMPSDNKKSTVIKAIQNREIGRRPAILAIIKEVSRLLTLA